MSFTVTCTVNLTGNNDLTDAEKSAFENSVVDKARAFAADLATETGGTVSSALAVTNTTGSVNLLEP